MSEKVLFIFAHPDDECFAASRIGFEVGLGNEVYCLFTTDGQAYGVSSKTRAQESLRALQSLGVPGKHLFFVGIDYGFRDGQSYKNLEAIYHAVGKVLPHALSRLYLMAWEGGHPDHDAAHLVGVAVGKRLGLPLFEFCGYNNGTCLGPFFRVLKFIPNGIGLNTRKLSFKEGVKAALLCRYHKSQWKTWVGLFPDLFYRLVIRRHEPLRPLGALDYHLPPHTPLFYEKRFHLPFHAFEKETRDFIGRYIDPVFHNEQG